MVNKIKVQVCDRCNIISPDVNCSNDTCMDCGEPLVLAEFVRLPTQRAADECPTCAGLGFVNDKRGRRGVDCSDCNGSGIRR